MSSKSKHHSNRLLRRYSVALRKQLAPEASASVRPAERLGREAQAVGLGTLDLARIHVRALMSLHPASLSAGNSHGMVVRAARFFVAVVRPFDGARRIALRNGSESRRRGAIVRRQAAELASARRRLKREMGRRVAMQDALKASEGHYGELLERSHRMQEHLRRLSHEILFAHEEERRKISRELHDEIGQTLTAINVKLATLRKEATVNTAGLKKKIASTQRLLERSMNTVHRFARELRPPLLDDLGLIPALHAYLKAFTRRTRIPVHFRAYAAVERLDIDKRTVLYRVAQEALMNVGKHAEASLVNVTIRKLGGVVRMEVRDDGKSFQVERVLFAGRPRRLGLIGMRERVEMVDGRFTVESAPGRGTTVRADIPLRNGRRGLPNAPAESVR